MLAAEQAIEAKLGRKGQLLPGYPPGHENDILANHNANPGGVTVLPDDLDALVARAGVHLSAKPGDLILAKDGGQQNLGVGYPLELFAPRGGKAVAEGLYVYCVDLHRSVPASGQGYDVLGPAADQSSGQLAALQ